MSTQLSAPAHLELHDLDGRNEYWEGYDGKYDVFTSEFWPIPDIDIVTRSLSTLFSHSQRASVHITISGCTSISRSRDCSQACAEPESLFMPRNFHSCIVLAAISLLVQNGTYLVDNSLTHSTIPDLASYNATAVFSNITHCISVSCSDTTLGSCGDHSRALGSIGTVTVDRLQNFYEGMDDYCYRLNPVFNSDIAGPGVSNNHAACA